MTGSGSLRAVQHGDQVLLVVNGELAGELPYQAALQVADAIRSVAKQAEEWANAERLAADGAVLLRAGAPFGLSRHPLILSEAVKQAVNDRDLRRYMPGGVKSAAIVGTPSLVQSEARAHEH